MNPHDPDRSDHDHDHHDLDVALVAFLDGECADADRRALRARLARDPDARARLQLLTAADRALRDGLGEPGARRGAGHLLLALAAAAVVGLVLALQIGGDGDRADRASARNDRVSVALAPQDGGSRPLFSDVAFELRLAQLQGHGKLAVYRETLDAATGKATLTGAQQASDELAGGTVPLWLSVEVTGPDGVARRATFADAGPIVVQGSQLELLRLLDLRVDDPAVARPYIGGALTRSGRLTEEFRRVLPEGTLVPTEPGLWTVAVTLRPHPAVEHPWPEARWPLRAESAVVLTARVSAWSEPVDGIAARFVVAEGVDELGRTPIALQLKNVGDRTRRYNVTGVTQAPIPQPFHFELLVDGDVWQLRDDLEVIIAAHTLDLDHAVGAVRSLIVAPDYWRRPVPEGQAAAGAAGARLADLPGPRALRLRFHHEALLWQDGDRELWQGEVATPALRIDVPTSR